MKKETIRKQIARVLKLVAMDCVQYPSLQHVNDNKDAIAEYLQKFGDYISPGITWLPYKVTPANVKLTCTLNQAFISYTDDTKRTIAGVSLFMASPCTAGIRVNSATYAANEEELMLHTYIMCSHVLKRVGPQEFGWNVVAQLLEQADGKKMAKTLEELLGERIPIRSDDPIDGALFTQPI